MAKSQHSRAYAVFRTQLKRARQAAGITQVGLAAKLGKPQSFVSKIESGERRLDVVEFLELADAVGFDPHEMLRRLRR